ncbi:MAG: DUF6713 family protein [Pseudomonadota bacterium]
MKDLLFWLYMANAIVLITHEIDSAYWKEWELFRLPGGPGGFLLLHVPMLLLILYGLVLVYTESLAGLVISLVLCGGGLFAFSIHTVFLKKGDGRFDAPVSKLLLRLTLLISLTQAGVTIYILV